jgi:hypothetical protein
MRTAFLLLSLAAVAAGSSLPAMIASVGNVLHVGLPNATHAVSIVGHDALAFAKSRQRRSMGIAYETPPHDRALGTNLFFDAPRNRALAMASYSVGSVSLSPRPGIYAIDMRTLDESLYVSRDGYYSGQAPDDLGFDIALTPNGSRLVVTAPLGNYFDNVYRGFVYTCAFPDCEQLELLDLHSALMPGVDKVLGHVVHPWTDTLWLVSVRLLDDPYWLCLYSFNPETGDYIRRERLCVRYSGMALIVEPARDPAHVWYTTQRDTTSTIEKWDGYDSPIFRMQVPRMDEYDHIWRIAESSEGWMAVATTQQLYLYDLLQPGTPLVSTLSLQPRLPRGMVWCGMHELCMGVWTATGERTFLLVRVTP